MAERAVPCRVLANARGMGSPLASQAQGAAPAPSSSTAEFSEASASTDAATTAPEPIPPRVIVNAEAQTPLNPWQRCGPLVCRLFAAVVGPTP